MKLYITLTFALLLGITSTLVGQSKLSKDKQCEISFENDSYQVDTATLKNCLKDLQGLTVEMFNVYASASFTGSQAYNQELTKKRVQAVSEVLATDFPNVKINVISGGENIRGRTALVTAVLVDHRPLEKLKAWRKNRISIRGTIDNYKNTDTNYETVGIDFTRLIGDENSLYGEYGLGVRYHADDDVKDLYSIVAIAGGYYDFYKGAVVGLRANAGRLSRTDNKEATIDVGGEARLGYDGERLSIFGLYGLSKELKTFGVEVSIRL